MKRCDHDKVFSGQINLSQHFAWICRKCGEQGWSKDYVLSQVNLGEYQHLRVLHGWATPRLPPPPRVPTNTEPVSRSGLPWAPGAIFFTFLAPVCALSAIPWGPLGPIMPLWAACVSTGIALLTATVFCVCWKKGL